MGRMREGKKGPEGEPQAFFMDRSFADAQDDNGRQDDNTRDR